MSAAALLPAAAVLALEVAAAGALVGAWLERRARRARRGADQSPAPAGARDHRIGRR